MGKEEAGRGSFAEFSLAALLLGKEIILLLPTGVVMHRLLSA